MKSVIIGKNQAGQRLDKFLHKYLPLAGDGFLYKMLRKKNITLNGKKAEGREMLALNDRVTLFFSDETYAKFSGRVDDIDAERRDSAGRKEGGETRDREVKRHSSALEEYEKAYKSLRGISILYEDADCLILNKPAGLLTQKASAGDISLNEWLIGYLLSKNKEPEQELAFFRPSVCNRLDRNTSGIVLCGKSLAGLQYLSSCIKERRIRKFYRTICTGSLEKAAIVRGYLEKDSRRNKVTISAEAPAGGSGEKAALIHTAFSPLEITDSYTLLEVELITGKSHQIRAHLADIGHPLIGDYKYGQESVNRILKERYGLGHHLLHACRVTFPKADQGPGIRLSGISVSAPWPELFRRMEEDLLHHKLSKSKTVRRYKNEPGEGK